MISWRRFKEFLRVAFGPKVDWRDYLEILKSAFQIARSPYSQEMWRARMVSKDNNSREQILEVRMQHLRQDLDMIEAKKERLESDRNSLILKLIAQREQLLALKEQDE
jgi:hypothetical protein